jgi:hypothetical protein
LGRLELKANLGKKKKRKKKIHEHQSQQMSQVWWDMPTIQAIWEAEVEGSQSKVTW